MHGNATETLVSIILPIYNAQEYLAETLDCLAGQSAESIELLCINDGSTDGTADILSEYAERDNRIRVITQHNQGAAAARNRGIDEAKGKYLAILDCDDLYERNMLERMLHCATEQDADIVVCRCDEFDTNGDNRRPYPNSIRQDLLPDVQPFAGTDVERDVFKLFIGWSWDKLFKRSFIEQESLRFQQLRTSNDMYFVFCAIVKAQRIVTMDDVLIHHRRGIGGLAETREKSWGCFHDALVRIRMQLQEWNLFARFEQDYINYCLHASFWNYDSLAEPAKGLLRDRLISEWFTEFGISDKDDGYFYYPDERRKYHLLMATGSPKISIVIPSLNSIDYYQECIDSALNQDMREIEVICVDAGSTDGTCQIITSSMRADPRVRHIHSDLRSYGYQMNAGIAAARGEYLMILESDDYILPNACSYYYELAAANQLDFVKSDHCMFYGNGSKRKFVTRELSQFSAYYNRLWNPSQTEHLLRLTTLTQPGIYNLGFIRHNNICYNESPGASYQDNGFWFKTSALATRAMFTHETLYMLRRDNPNSSVMSKGKVFTICEEYDFIRTWLTENHLDNFLPMCTVKRCDNYFFTVERIGEWHLPDFFDRWAKDFRELDEAGELDRRYFTSYIWNTLQEIMKEGRDYYRLGWRTNQQTQERVAETNREIRRYKKMANSASFKLGHALIEPTRQMLRVVKTKRLIPSASNHQKIYNPFCGDFYTYASNLEEEAFEQELPSLIQVEAAKRLAITLDLEQPASLTELMHWHKIHSYTDEHRTMLSDIYRMRSWVRDTIGDKYLRKVYGTWNNADHIDFDSMPNKFTLRCSHAPFLRIDVPNKDKVDEGFIRKQLGIWLNGNPAYMPSLLTQYKNASALAFAEDFPSTESETLQLWCFNGAVRYIQKRVFSNGHFNSSFFDTAWRPQPFGWIEPCLEDTVPSPVQLKEIVNMGNKLSQNLDFVCIEVEVTAMGSIFVRAFDFFPQDGCFEWFPAETNWLIHL